VVTFWSVIFQTFEPATASAIEACMWSPGWTVTLVIDSDGAGISSYQAE
jgi:hypothetical protein